jgi:hypothetical protein
VVDAERREGVAVQGAVRREVGPLLRPVVAVAVDRDCVGGLSGAATQEGFESLVSGLVVGICAGLVVQAREQGQGESLRHARIPGRGDEVAGPVVAVARVRVREIPGAARGYAALDEATGLRLCPLQEERVACHAKRVDVLEAIRSLGPGLIVEHPVDEAHADALGVVGRVVLARDRGGVGEGLLRDRQVAQGVRVLVVAEGERRTVGRFVCGCWRSERHQRDDHQEDQGDRPRAPHRLAAHPCPPTLFAVIAPPGVEAISGKRRSQ